MDYRWSSEPLNLLSPEVIAKVSNALDAGMICGVYAFYCGGCGPEPCAFADLNSYISDVEKSRPGDRFTLWSVPMLADAGILLIWKQKSPITNEEFRRSKDWLDAVPRREFLAAGYPETGAPPEAKWGDSDWFEWLEDLAHKCATTGEFDARGSPTRRGRLEASAILDLTDIDITMPPR